MVRQAFFAMMSAQIIPDLEQVYGFIPVAQYPSQMNILQAEWGSVKIFLNAEHKSTLIDLEIAA